MVVTQTELGFSSLPVPAVGTGAKAAPEAVPRPQLSRR